MHDVEHHQAVSVFQILCNGGGQLLRMVVELVHQYAAHEGSAAEDTAQLLAGTFHAVPDALLCLAVGLVPDYVVALLILLDGDVGVVVAGGIEVQKLVIAVVLILRCGPVELLRGVVFTAGEVYLLHSKRDTMHRCMCRRKYWG
jgi:hypothetical protein